MLNVEYDSIFIKLLDINVEFMQKMLEIEVNFVLVILFVILNVISIHKVIDMLLVVDHNHFYINFAFIKYFFHIIISYVKIINN